VFPVLPFGLSPAPHIFTKTLEHLEKHWTHQGICIASFLNHCSSIAKAVKIDLGEAVFITNDEKSVWEPCPQIVWLGLIWDSARGLIEITVDRRCGIDSVADSDFLISA